MKESVYKKHNEAKMLGGSRSRGYALKQQPDYPVLRVGNRMGLPTETHITGGE